MKLRAWIEVEITGAAPERCLNRFSRKDVGFWCLNVDGPFRLTCRLLAADWPRAEREITAALCACKVLKRGGLVYALSGLRRRPVLVIGVGLAWALAFLAQYFVWFVRVEPSDQISAERIRQALSEEGVRFGVWGPGLDTQWFKNRMLNRIPELRWLGVHTEGGIAVVDYSVRDEPIRQGTPLTACKRCRCPRRDRNVAFGPQRSGRRRARHGGPRGRAVGLRADRLPDSHADHAGRGGRGSSDGAPISGKNAARCLEKSLHGPDRDRQNTDFSEISKKYFRKQ